MNAMTASPMFKIQPDAARNLVHIWYQGHVTAAGMAACVKEVERHLPAMRAGFTMLTDLTALEAMELDCVPHLTRIMDLSKAQGVGTVVRVIPDRAKDIGFNILSIIHLRRGVKVVTCDTLAEAERALKS
jgi:hypothetical protein